MPGWIRHARTGAAPGSEHVGRVARDRERARSLHGGTTTSSSWIRRRIACGRSTGVRSSVGGFDSPAISIPCRSWAARLKNRTLRVRKSIDACRDLSMRPRSSSLTARPSGFSIQGLETRRSEKRVAAPVSRGASVSGAHSRPQPCRIRRGRQPLQRGLRRSGAGDDDRPGNAPPSRAWIGGTAARNLSGSSGGGGSADVDDK